MNPFLIFLASIGPLIIIAASIWGIIGPDRHKKQFGVGIYGGVYSQPNWSAGIIALAFTVDLTYHGIKWAMQGDTLGTYFVFTSIAIMTLFLLWLAYKFAKPRRKRKP